MVILFQLLLLGIALFMILLILVQKGRGGGLAGALGGPGGSSAFGAKAGDAFTKITAYTALVWMAVCISASLYFSSGGPGATDSRLDELERRRAATTSSESSDEGAGSSDEADPATQP